MQLLPRLTDDASVARREKPAGAHLPYARHVDDVTLETRDGLLMQTIHLGGLLFETADSDELNYRAELRDAMLRAIGSSRFAIHHHVIRRRADAAIEGEFGDEFSRRLDERWRERLGAKQMYVNELFVTILRRPLRGRLGWADRLRGLFARSVEPRDVTFAADLRSLNAARDALVAALSQYAPRVLSVYESEDGFRSEPLEFLSCLYNGEMRPVGLPHGDIGMHLPWRRISFGQDAVELGPAGQEPRRFVGLVSIKAAMDGLGNADKQEVGRWTNNRTENSHPPFRRRKRVMLRFRQMKSLQKFASVGANVHNHFNFERHLADPQTYKTRRSAALAEWQSLMA